MESRSDFLLLPDDVRMIIYSNLPSSSLAPLFILSTLINQEIKEYYKHLYGKTNQIVSDFLNSQQDEFYKRPNIIACTKSMTFQQFIRENYLQFDTDHFQPKEKAEANNYFGQGLIYFEIKDNELVCWAINAFQQRLEVKIQSSCFENTPLMLEMVKPFENEIKQKLGEASVKAFLVNLGSGWAGSFLDDKFQDCYKNGQINYDYLGYFDQELMKSPYCRGKDSKPAALDPAKLHFIQVASNYIKGSSLNLLDYAYFLNDKLEPNKPVLDWLKKHPKELEVEYLHKIKKLNIIQNEAYFSLIQKDVVTIDECLAFGKKLFILTQFPESMHSFIQADRRIVIESFCEGLGADPSQLIKGRAVKELLNYIITRYEEAEKEREESSAYQFTNFFKKLQGRDNFSKVNAAIILAHVLLQAPVYSLLERHIAVLTKNLGSESEDRLTKIVRTMVLEPLGLKSLEEINTKNIFSNSKKYATSNGSEDESYLWTPTKGL